MHIGLTIGLSSPGSSFSTVTATSSVDADAAATTLAFSPSVSWASVDSQPAGATAAISGTDITLDPTGWGHLATDETATVSFNATATGGGKYRIVVTIQGVAIRPAVAGPNLLTGEPIGGNVSYFTAVPSLKSTSCTMEWTGVAAQYPTLAWAIPAFTGGKSFWARLTNTANSIATIRLSAESDLAPNVAQPGAGSGYDGLITASNSGSYFGVHDVSPTSRADVVDYIFTAELRDVSRTLTPPSGTFAALFPADLVPGSTVTIDLRDVFPEADVTRTANVGSVDVDGYTWTWTVPTVEQTVDVVFTGTADGTGATNRVSGTVTVSGDLYATVTATPPMPDRIYMAGPQHVVLDVHDADLTWGGLSDDLEDAGALVYLLGDRDEPRRQKFVTRVAREPWWTAMASPDAITFAAGDPRENWTSDTTTPLAGVVASNYSVSINGGAGAAPTAVHRWSPMGEAARSDLGGNPTVYVHRHRIVLTLASPVLDGQTVAVTYTQPITLATATLTCTAGASETDLIRVSQVGYEAGATKRAILGQWLGGRPSDLTGSATLVNLGTDDTLPASPTWILRNLDTGAEADSGLWVEQTGGYTVTLTSGVHTTGLNADASPVTIYTADFDAVTTPGRYRIEVPGVGHSCEFPIREGVALDVARLIANAFTLTRRDQAQDWAGSHWSPAGYTVKGGTWPHMLSSIRQQQTSEGPSGSKPDKYGLLHADPLLDVASVGGSPGAVILTMTNAQTWQVGDVIATGHRDGTDPDFWGRTYTITGKTSDTVFTIDGGFVPSGSVTNAQAGLAVTPRYGWRDAADLDHRPQHGQLARTMIMCALASADFRAATLRQPETDGYSRPVRLFGSETTITMPAGLSHLVREAAWSIDGFLDIQRSDGWVSGGSEISQYLNGTDGGSGLAISGKVCSYLYAHDAYASMELAASAGLMAFYLDRHHPGNTAAAQYRSAAIAAYNAAFSTAGATQIDTTDAIGSAIPVRIGRVMAPLCLWLATGSDTYRDAFFDASVPDAPEGSAATIAEPIGLWLWAHKEGVVSHDPGGTRVSTWRSRALTEATTNLSGANVAPFDGLSIRTANNNGAYSNSLGLPNHTAERGFAAIMGLDGADLTSAIATLGPFAARETLWGLGANASGYPTISGIGARPLPSYTFRDHYSLTSRSLPPGIATFGPASKATLGSPLGATYLVDATRRGYPPIDDIPWAGNFNGQRDYAPIAEWTPFTSADWLVAMLILHAAYA